MKHLFTFLTIAALSLSSQEVLASALAQKSPGDQAALQAQFGEMSMSASDFAALTPKEIAKKTGKKMSWGEKILFKIAQKRIKKQLAKGVQPSSSEGKAKGSSKNGIISLILTGLGVGVAFLAMIPVDGGILVLLGAICVITGLVFGISGIINDENNTLAIIGTVLSTVVIGFGLWLLFALLGEIE